MFFKKKPKGPTKKYIAYMSKMAKYLVVMTKFSEAPGQQLIVYFFDQTRSEIEQMSQAIGITLKSPNELANENDLILCSAYELGTNQFGSINKVVAMEVHPIGSTNELIVKRFEGETDMEIEFHLGMDEAALAPFGMDRITNIMKQMGMQENEPIEHSMVARSIEKGLAKQEAKLGSNHQDIRTSQEDWMSANKC